MSDELEEMKGLRSAGAKVFAVPGGGAHYAQIFNEPVHYLGPDGSWREIDATIVDTPGGYRNAAHAFDVFFPEKLASETPVRMGFGDGSLEMSIAGASHDVQAQARDTSVVYPQVLRGADLEYRLTAEGFKENLVLRSPQATKTVTYRIVAHGVSLVKNAEGHVEVRDEAGALGFFPQFFAVDSAGEDGGPGSTTWDVATTLTEVEPGVYELTASIDAGWFEDRARRFPVTLDPAWVNSRCGACPVGVGVPALKDMSYTTGGGGYGWENHEALRAGEVVGCCMARESKAYMTFDVAQEIRKKGRLVYDAKFDINNFGGEITYNDGRTFQMKRITADWTEYPGSNPTLPLVDQSKVWSTFDKCISWCQWGTWWQWDVKSIMQYWMDMGVPSNHGWEISVAAGANTDWRSFWSKEAGLDSNRPYLAVVINAMPSTRELTMDDPNWPYLDLAWDAPWDGEPFVNTGPTFKIQDLNDTNLDPVKVRYQISKSKDNFDQAVVYDTGWIQETLQHTVQPSQLAPGTYYWRVQGNDVCDAQEDLPWIDQDDPVAQEAKLCDDLSHVKPRARPITDRPTSVIRQFTFTKDEPRRGTDPRWEMWSQELGNDMFLGVDQASGNVVLRYPMDTLDTAGPALKLGLAYNSDGTNETTEGMPPGWILSAGPGGKSGQVPVRIAPQGDYAAAVVYESGRRDTFVSTDGRTFRTIGPYASTVRKVKDKGWTLTTFNGGVFSFDALGGLTSARPSTSTPGTPGFTYEFVPGTRKLAWVADPAGRKVNVEYDAPGGRLSRIVSWTNASWAVSYNSAGRIETITDPANAAVKFTYDGAGNMIAVTDGEARTKPTVYSTVIKYAARNNSHLASEIRLAGSTDSWNFTYAWANATAKVASSTTVEDPRGRLTGDVNDFKVITDFGVDGLPIMRRGPAVPGEPVWPIERWRWDVNGNMACHRSVAANAIADVPCLRENAASGVDALQTEYKYQKDAPYLMTLRREPQPSLASTAPRLATKWEYDQGFQGLQGHYFDNLDLAGLPKKVQGTGNVDFDWTWASPFAENAKSPLGGWSGRWFGEYLAGHATGDKLYKFRVVTSAGDFVRVAVGDKLVIDCWSATVACTPAGSVSLAPGPHPITVEFVDNGPEGGKLQLREEHDMYIVVPAHSFSPKADAVTTVSTGTLDGPGGGMNALEKSTYTYPVRQEYLKLPSVRKVTGDGIEAWETRYSYDIYGRTTSEADFNQAGTVAGRKVETKFDAVGCPYESTKWLTDTSKLVTARTCNSGGDIATETVAVGDVILADDTIPATPEQRKTTMTYDALGRLKRTDYPDGGVTTLEYDDAGRLETRTQKLNASEVRTWRFYYTPQGWLEKKELPDRDRNATTPVPTTTYTFDAVGNRKTVVNPLGKSWKFDYNSLNVQTRKEDPVGNVWTWTHDRAGWVRLAEQPKVTPDGGTIKVFTTYDVQGRALTTQLDDLTPTRNEYDLRGRLKSTTDADGIKTSWTYDADDNKLSETAPVGEAPVNDPSAMKTRTFTYDPFGRLKIAKDFRQNATTYEYDRGGRLISVTQPHGVPNVTRYFYNQAGDLERKRLAKTASESIDYEYDYDKMGRVVRERNGLGKETTHDYDLAGQERSSMDPRFVFYQYDYDGAGNRTYATATNQTSGSSVSETFTFDDADNLTGATNENRTVTMSYDDAGRVDLVTSGQAVTDYTYAGSVLSSRSDRAGVTSYSYFAGTGRLRTVTTPFSPIAAEFTYTDAGRPKTRKDPNGIVHTNTFDGFGRVQKSTSVDSNSRQIALFTQRFDLDSNVVVRNNEIESGDDNGTWGYAYDASGRLVKATDPAGEATDYSYDGAGNRTKVVHIETTPAAKVTTRSTTTYDVGSQPIQTTTTTQVDSLPEVPSTTTTYKHDAAGNLEGVDDGVTKWTYGYDSWGRMSSTSKSLSLTQIPLASTYRYDALDRTVSKDVTLTTPAGAVTQQGTVNTYAGLTEELVSSTLAVETPVLVTSTEDLYAYGGGAAIALKQQTQTTTNGTTTAPVQTLSYLGTSPHSDVTFATGADATVSGTKSYDPWGVIRTQEGETSTLGYQSDPTDEETGLVDMGARYYLPSLGRFTTEDSYEGEIGDPITENRYVYGGDDPVSSYDPTGHMQNDIGNGGSQKTGGGPAAQVHHAYGNPGTINAYNELTDRSQSLHDVHLQANIENKWDNNLRALAVSVDLPVSAIDPLCQSAPRSNVGRTLTMCYHQIWSSTGMGSGPLPTPPTARFVSYFTGSTDFSDLEADLADRARAEFAADAKAVAGAALRLADRARRCWGDPICTTSYYGSWSISLCVGRCLNVAVSRANGQSQFGIGLSGLSSIGATVLFSPGQSLSEEATLSGGVCPPTGPVAPCLGVNRSPDGQMSGSVGVGTPGGWGGVSGMHVFEMGPSE